MKGKKWMACRIIPALGLVILISGAGAAAFAAELRDYTLPSQRRLPNDVNVQQMAPPGREVLPPPPQESEFNPVYEKFRAEVAPLKPAKRKSLKTAMEKKLRASTTAEQQAYYQKLIAILDELGTR